MFDKMVTPILLTYCEIWGFENLDIIEKIHLKFCKTSTPNFMIYGELCRHLLSVIVKMRMMKYWVKLLNGKSTKLSHTSILYKLLHALSIRNEGAHFKWLKCIQNILQNCGLNFIWLSQTIVHEELLLWKQILCDQFKQKWSSDCNESSKGIFYNLFTNCIFAHRKYLNVDILKKCHNVSKI